MWCERSSNSSRPTGLAGRGRTLGAAGRGAALAHLWHHLWRPTGMGRLVRYGVVGAGGVVVNLGVLWVLRHWDILGPLRAPIVSIECAIVHNFLWNELWVFRDRAQHAARVRQRLGRLLHFHGTCALGTALHLGIVWLVALRWQWPYMWTNLLAIAVVAAWNYGVNTSWTWASGTLKRHPWIILLLSLVVLSRRVP